VKLPKKRLHTVFRRPEGDPCGWKTGYATASRDKQSAIVNNRIAGICLRGSPAIGDRLSDVKLGLNLGGPGILVMTGYGKRSLPLIRRERIRPTVIVRNLKAAARWITSRGDRLPGNGTKPARASQMRMLG
jgi:hypothetical protein